MLANSLCDSTGMPRSQAKNVAGSNGTAAPGPAGAPPWPTGNKGEFMAAGSGGPVGAVDGSCVASDGVVTAGVAVGAVGAAAGAAGRELAIHDMICVMGTVDPLASGIVDPGS